ncbi:hypothetical protein CC79DRAFT_546981 [Sarocladium strictum]
MSTQVFDRIVEADNLPAPATKLVITRCFSRCEYPAFWALLIIGKFYDSAGRVIWSTEIFLGQFSWLDDEESSSQSGTESDTASDSDSEATHSVVSSSEEDTESQDEEQSEFESSSGKTLPPIKLTNLPPGFGIPDCLLNFQANANTRGSCFIIPRTDIGRHRGY